MALVTIKGATRWAKGQDLSFKVSDAEANCGGKGASNQWKDGLRLDCKSLLLTQYNLKKENVSQVLTLKCQKHSHSASVSWAQWGPSSLGVPAFLTVLHSLHSAGMLPAWTSWALVLVRGQLVCSVFWTRRMSSSTSINGTPKIPWNAEKEDRLMRKLHSCVTPWDFPHTKKLSLGLWSLVWSGPMGKPKGVCSIVLWSQVCSKKTKEIGNLKSIAILIFLN